MKDVGSWKAPALLDVQSGSVVQQSQFKSLLKQVETEACCAWGDEPAPSVQRDQPAMNS